MEYHDHLKTLKSLLDVKCNLMQDLEPAELQALDNELCKLYRVNYPVSDKTIEALNASVLMLTISRENAKTLLREWLEMESPHPLYLTTAEYLEKN